MLKLEGHHVTEAKNGKHSVEAAKQKFNLILIDISLQVMDGIETSRRIRSSECASADTPIIAVTAHGMLDEMLKLLQPTNASSKGKLTKVTIGLVHRAAESVAVLGAIALHQKLNMIELAARSDRAYQV